MNTTDYFLQMANDANCAFVTSDASLSYGAFKHICAGLVCELREHAIQAGDRVAILGRNSPAWAAAYLAILKIGAVAVPVSNLLPPEDVKRNLELVDCKFIFIDKALQVRYANQVAGLPALLLEEAPLKASSHPWEMSPPDFNLEADAALMFTSGTTARPRMVRVTHRNLQANTNSIIEYLKLTEHERIMVVLPFYYCYGASLLHTHLRVGATLVISNTFTYPETVLDLMEKAECTGLAGVPSTYQILLRNSSYPKRALPHLRKIQQAGGKLHDALIKELISTHPLARVYVMYGQTEATARLSYLPPELLATKLGSIGRGIPGVKLTVVDENGQPIHAGEVGEIIASGENISPGYLDDPEANREKFINGSLSTGDLATVDDDGFIYIVDRKSDFIKSLGHRLSSYEIESCILQNQQVVAAAAVGVPDETAGELVKVFVILCKGSTLKPDDLLKHCQAHLPRYMLPHEIILTASFPMNAHGKVLKSELRKLGKSG